MVGSTGGREYGMEGGREYGSTGVQLYRCMGVQSPGYGSVQFGVDIRDPWNTSSRIQAVGTPPKTRAGARSVIDLVPI